METFRKLQDEVIGGYNEKNWFAVDVSKNCPRFCKSCIDSCCVVRLIDDLGGAIGRLHQTIQNAI